MLEQTKNYIPFKQKYTFEQRLAKYQKIKANNPDKIMVIVERHEKASGSRRFNGRFLVPQAMKIRQVVPLIKRKIKEAFSKEDQFKQLLLTTNYRLITEDQALTIRDLYENHKEKDNMLYIYFHVQESFGRMKIGWAIAIILFYVLAGLIVQK